MSACVGVTECPCRKCTRLRMSATSAHPTHSRPEAGLCWACRTAVLQAEYRVMFRD